MKGESGISIKQRIRHIRRRQQIVAVLARNGFGFLIERFGLITLLPFSSRRVIHDQREPDNLLAVKFRKALEELGPTFIKLGQLLSTRPDILRPAFVEQLEHLQDKVQAIPYQAVVQQLEKELGHPDEVFAEFDPQPLAAASIGQVHRAQLKSGEQVIVKIQRPDIEQKIAEDLRIILAVARLSEARSEEARRIGIAAMIEDYGKMLMRELDYAREARSTQRTYNNFADDPRVMIPAVYRDYTTRRVLVEEYIEGVKLSDVEEIKRRGWDVRKISRLGTEAFLGQIMLHGFFQADPHPGNILVVDEERVAFIDFGETGSISRNRIVNLGEILLGISQEDMDQVMSAFQEIGILENMVGDREDFIEDLEELFMSAASEGLGNLDMNRIRTELLGLAYTYRLKMPPYLTSLMKALITVQGVGKKLDPAYDFMETARPLAKKIYGDRLKPESISRQLKQTYYRDIKPLKNLPGNFNDLVKTTAGGQLELMIKLDLTDRAYRRLSRMASRLSASLIITGGLVGSALLVQTSHPSVFDRYEHLGIAVIGVAAVTIIIFIYSFIKS